MKSKFQGLRAILMEKIGKEVILFKFALQHRISLLIKINGMNHSLNGINAMGMM